MISWQQTSIVIFNHLVSYIIVFLFILNNYHLLGPQVFIEVVGGFWSKIHPHPFNRLRVLSEAYPQLESLWGAFFTWMEVPSWRLRPQRGWGGLRGWELGGMRFGGLTGLIRYFWGCRMPVSETEVSENLKGIKAPSFLSCYIVANSHHPYWRTVWFVQVGIEVPTCPTYRRWVAMLCCFGNSLQIDPFPDRWCTEINSSKGKGWSEKQVLVFAWNNNWIETTGFEILEHTMNVESIHFFTEALFQEFDDSTRMWMLIGHILLFRSLVSNPHSNTHSVQETSHFWYVSLCQAQDTPPHNGENTRTLRLTLAWKKIEMFAHPPKTSCLLSRILAL